MRKKEGKEINSKYFHILCMCLLFRKPSLPKNLPIPDYLDLKGIH
jgi:hypothetical protein